MGQCDKSINLIETIQTLTITIFDSGVQKNYNDILQVFDILLDDSTIDKEVLISNSVLFFIQVLDKQDLSTYPLVKLNLDILRNFSIKLGLKEILMGALSDNSFSDNSPVKKESNTKDKNEQSQVLREILENPDIKQKTIFTYEINADGSKGSLIDTKVISTEPMSEEDIFAGLVDNTVLSEKK